MTIRDRKPATRGDGERRRPSAEPAPSDEGSLRTPAAAIDTHAIDANSERFAAIVRDIQDYAIFMLDREGHVMSWNAGARSIKGYEADEIVGRHFSTFYTAEDNSAGKPEREL